jgi:hypothetical protein
MDGGTIYSFLWVVYILFDHKYYYYIKVGVRAKYYIKVGVIYIDMGDTI